MDNAATTIHKPEEVRAAVMAAFDTLGNAGRGASAPALDASRVIYDTREKLARLFHAGDARQIVFTANSTESLNIAIKGLFSEGDHVITTVMEHNSVLRPLYECRERGTELTILGCDGKGNISYEEMEAAVRENTKAVVCTHASNLTGNMIGLERVGAPGTTAALALLNDQVKKGGVMASSYVGGLSGAFIPVSEDQGMIDAVNAGALTLEKLEAMTCVCSVGLDMIAVPGKTSPSTLAGIIADEMAIGMVNQKTTAVRLIPVIGKDVGETAEFGGLLGYAPIMPVNEFGCETFISRKGRIPAPIHSFKN